MAKKGASILGGPGGEDRQRKLETSSSKMSSKRQGWTFHFLLSISHRFSSRPREDKSIRIKKA
jgi:hypothetical protein